MQTYLTQEMNVRHNISMSYIIAGLGNPGEEYQHTRHNAGRMIVEYLQKKWEGAEFKENPKIKALVAQGKIKKESITFVLPNNFMNRSGASLAPLVTSVKKAHNLIVIYDDLDLPLGTLKISFNRSSGGHRGVESIIKALKTQEFIRIRVGISPVTAGGKIKKPKGEQEVDKYIIGVFKKQESETLKKIEKKVGEIVEMIVLESKEKAMDMFNSK